MPHPIKNPIPFVGLTGGIGSGKTQVSNIFASLGVSIIDTDEIAHQLTAPDSVALPRIRKIFGNSAFHDNGQLNRTYLRERIFKVTAYKKELEKILHPLILARTKNQMTSAKGLYGILVVPLLFEKPEFLDLVDRSLVVDCEEDIQIQRVIQRSHLTEETVKQIITQQISRKERLIYANDVIINNSGLEQLQQQVLTLHEAYIKRYTFKRRGSDDLL